MDGGEKELGGREGAFKVLLLVTGYRWRGWGWSLGGGGSREPGGGCVRSLWIGRACGMLSGFGRGVVILPRRDREFGFLACFLFAMVFWAWVMF
jgi:hypothetical protein